MRLNTVSTTHLIMTNAASHVNKFFILSVTDKDAHTDSTLKLMVTLVALYNGNLAIGVLETVFDVTTRSTDVTAAAAIAVPLACMFS